MTPGGPGTELMDGIESADSDLFSTRIGGLSPVNGTDVPTLLRNLGAKTVVIAGVSTNVAIPNATLDCVNFGFNVVIARDAITGTRSTTPTSSSRTRSRWSPRSRPPTSSSSLWSVDR